MKSAVRQILLSPSPINPSPNSLFLPVSGSNWLTTNVSIGSEGVLSEDSTNGVHHILRQSPFFSLQDNVPYRWTVWVRPLNRRFCYLTIAPSGGGNRFVTVWGLDGQGLLDTRPIPPSTNFTNTSFSYKRIQQGICKIVFNFTIISGASTQIPVIGAVNTFPPTYTANFDVTYQGLNYPSIQILANECVPV